jgi:protein arginine N-methyltransferase 1
MYSIAMYGFMIGDDARMDAYAEAMRRAINPDSVVVDIGAGAGIFSLLACQFGARRVYAIESADAIQIAREIAKVNQCVERIEFIQKLSTEVELPEKADIIISDIRGLLPFLGHHIPSIADARARFLKPGGMLIPQRDDVWVAIVDAEESYKEYLNPWEKYGLDMSAAKRVVTNTNGWRVKNISPDMMISPPQLWAKLDYSTISDPNVAGALSFTADRDGDAHGMLVWFDATMADGVGFSNAPGVENPTQVYGRSFFPWPRPVDLEMGDRIDLRIEARLVGDEYVYRWETMIKSKGDVQETKAHFNQSTFYGEPLSLDRLRKQSDAYIPELNPEGVLDQFILTRMNGRAPLGDIARQVAEQYPEKFPRWQDALTRVGELARKYSK